MIPISVKSRVPFTDRARHLRLLVTPAGIRRSGQTIDSSRLVRVTEKNADARAHPGISSEGRKRQIPNISGRSVSVSFLISVRPFARQPVGPFAIHSVFGNWYLVFCNLFVICNFLFVIVSLNVHLTPET